MIGEKKSYVLQAEAGIDGYRVVRPLGRGGMAEVYEVERVKTGAAYAMKLFVCAQDGADFLEKRFLAEGRLLAKFHHPRVVRVYDYGFAVVCETRLPYYVMDLVLNENGEPMSLRDALEKGVASEDKAVGWYGDLREALAFIHSHGVVHRDVSLDNVLVGPDGRAVLSDFGVSKVMDRDLRAELEMSLVTVATGGRPLMGKTFYLAPEVKKGGAEGPAADYYALGVLMFYLLNQVWYTPGANLDGMLALFDGGWRKVLGALLEEDPELRKCPQWERDEVELPPQKFRLPLVLLAVTVIVFALVAAGVVFREWRLSRAIDSVCQIPSAKLDDVPQSALVDSAWVVRGIVAGGKKAGLKPGEIAETLGGLVYEGSDSQREAAMNFLLRQSRFLLAVEAGDANLAEETLDDSDIPEVVLPELRAKLKEIKHDVP